MTAGSRARLLVVGASGLVGTEVARRAAARWDVLGVARHVDGLATEVLELGDPAAVKGLLGRFEPDVVVVASAWPWVDGCERDPERSRRENVETVRTLVDAARPTTRLVFFSTEHVFDGRAEAYDEAAPTHPLSVYARHKRDVEELLTARGNALVARTSYVFGAEQRRKNFLYRVIDAARDGTPLKVPSLQAGMPTWSGWLAEATLSLLDGGVTGLVHLVGPEVLTKAEWARKVQEGLSLPPVDIVEVPWQDAGQVAPRPERVRLVSTRHQLVHPPLLDVLRTERPALLEKKAP
ncbi:MAG: SDR family oxidoreductase [Myxococcota bacterium]